MDVHRTHASKSRGRGRRILARLLKVSLVWQRVIGSMWFIPGVLVVAAAILGEILVQYDARSGGYLANRWPQVFAFGAEGARSILSAIATSMIGVSGIAFSVTVVALSLAAAQYTSRVLRNFMRDRCNQTVLGVLLGVFVYCLVVLRVVRGGDEGPFVPSVAVAASMVLALVAIGYFIFFIHHISASIQAEAIVSRVARETLDVIDRVYPTEYGEGEDADDPVELSPPREAKEDGEGGWTPIHSNTSGYVQGIGLAAIGDVAERLETQIRCRPEVGEFVCAGNVLAWVKRAEELKEEDSADIHDSFVLGSERTIHQDPGYGIRQIVDVALKALSPGINDSTTAVNCVNYLHTILDVLARRCLTRVDSRDGRGVAAAETSFESYLTLAVTQIRQYGSSNLAVLERLMHVLQSISGRTSSRVRKDAIVRQLQLVAWAAASRTEAVQPDWAGPPRGGIESIALFAKKGANSN